MGRTRAAENRRQRGALTCFRDPKRPRNCFWDIICSPGLERLLVAGDVVTSRVPVASPVYVTPFEILDLPIKDIIWLFGYSGYTLSLGHMVLCLIPTNPWSFYKQKVHLKQALGCLILQRKEALFEGVRKCL